MIDLRAWRERGEAWRERGEAAAERRLNQFRNRSSNRTWPLLGVLALGLVAGAAIGIVIASQQSPLRRLGWRVSRFIDEGSVEPDVMVTSHRTNHGRKAAAEV